MIYHISPTGLIGNSGSINATLPPSAVPAITTAEAILFQSGARFGGIRLSHKGIKFGMYGSGGMPVFSAMVRASTWKAIGNGLWTYRNTALNSGLKLLLFDGLEQPKGQYRENGYLSIKADHTGGMLAVDSLPFDATGAQVVIRKEKFITDTHTILKHVPGQIEYNHNPGDANGFGKDYAVKKGYGCFIQNHVKCLTKLGDWMYDPATKTVTMFFGDRNPSEFKIEIPTSYEGITLDGCEDLELSQLSVSGVNGAGIKITRSKNIFAEHIIVRNTGAQGIYSPDATCSDIKFHDTEVSDTILNGIYFGYQNHRISIVKSNVTRAGLNEGGGEQAGNGDSKGDGISLQWGLENTVLGCTVKQVGHNGIAIGGAGANVIDSTVEEYALEKADSGGIYTYTGEETYESGESLLIKGNKVSKGYGKMEGTNETIPVAHNIYLDDESGKFGGVKIIGNLSTKSRGSGLYLHNTKNVHVEGNDIVGNARQVNLNQDNGRTIKETVVIGNKLACEHPDQSLIYAHGMDQYGKWQENNYYHVGDQARFEVDKGENPYNFGVGFKAWQALTGETGKVINILPFHTEAIEARTIQSPVILAPGRKDVYLPIGPVEAGDFIRVWGTAKGDFTRLSITPELSFRNPDQFPRAKKFDETEFNLVFPIAAGRDIEKLMILTEADFKGAELTLNVEKVKAYPVNVNVVDYNSNPYALFLPGEPVAPVEPKPMLIDLPSAPDGYRYQVRVELVKV